jgi:hypothetical protein
MDQRQSSEEPLMTRIGQAVILLHGGDREEARNRFGALWAEIGEMGDPVQLCTLALYMADTQDDPGDELAWDLRALTAADGQAPRDGRSTTQGAPPPAASAAVRAFYPSLHLSLAADYVKLRRPQAARLHLDRARAAADALEDDGHGNGVRTAIDRLELRLREG